MNNVALAADGAWKVLVASLVLGAGLPIIFALGVRARAYAAGGGTDGHHTERHPVGNVLAALPLTVIDRTRDAVERVARRSERLREPLTRTSKVLAGAAGVVEQAPFMRSSERSSTRVPRGE